MKRENNFFQILTHVVLNNCSGKLNCARLIGVVLIFPIFTSCHIYSFTGASIDKNDSTFTVHFITNQAPVVVPSLSQTLTDALKNKFLTSTNLALVQSNG